jgi:hypothetical protein
MRLLIGASRTVVRCMQGACGFAVRAYNLCAWRLKHLILRVFYGGRDRD